MQSLIETLSPTDSAVQLRIAERLATAFPDLVRKPFSNLNIDTFAYRNRCTVTWRNAPMPAEEFYCGGIEHDSIGRNVASGIADLEWQGKSFVLASFEWQIGYNTKSQNWLIGEDAAAVDALALAIYRETNTPQNAVLVFSGGCWNENASQYKSIQSSSFEALTLELALVTELRRDFRAFLSMQADYESLNVPWRRGVMFLGPPGNGKTQCLRALARELDLPTLYVQSLKAQYQTEESMINKVFSRARQLQPCLLVFEDIDALITPSNRSVFLNQMDGFERNVGMIVVATTNHPQRLDPALLDRPSRFDRKYHFPLPSEDLRRRYIEGWRQRLAERVTLRDDLVTWLMRESDGFSFAYLQELFVSALMKLAAKETDDPDQSLRTSLVTLREQMKTGREMLSPAPADEDEDEDAF